MSEEEDFVRAGLRKDFKQDQQFLRLLLMAAMGLSALGAVGFIYLQINAIPKPVYFEETKDKQLIKPLSLTKENLSEPELKNWIAEIMSQVFSFNFNNQPKILRDADEYFTNTGHKQFIELLKTVDLFRRVKKDRWVLSATIVEAPKLKKTAVLNNRFSWLMSVPVLVNIQSPKIFIKREILVTMMIQRVPAKESPLGIKIDKIFGKIRAENERV